MVEQPRSSRNHVFGIFTPAKNHRFQALSAPDAEDWVNLIGAQAPIDETQEAFLALTRNSRTNHYSSDAESMGFGKAAKQQQQQNLYSQQHEYLSANEVTSLSDSSDGPRPSRGSIIRRRPDSVVSFKVSSISIAKPSPTTTRLRAASVLRDPERVLCEDYLQCLRTKGSVRQWKRLWVVLRPKSITFYKDLQEYSAVRIIPMSDVINAAEIEPISRSKMFCLQIIADKSYRLCAPNEETLARWLGALKSIVVAHKKLFESQQ